MCDQKKMDNVINDDDPALIKNKFCSFYNIRLYLVAQP